jgi:hypothetical protein
MCDQKPVKGDVFCCNECGMEIKCTKPCGCTDGEKLPCFECCGQEMVKKD